MANIFQTIAKQTGKSVDEIMEYFGKKAGQAPPVPMGSGKNLEVLQEARVGAPQARGAYPSNIGQDDLSLKGDFSLQDSPYTKDFTLPDADAGLPVPRSNTLPSALDDVVEESIETLPAIRNVSQSVDEIGETLPTTFRQVPEDVISRFKRMDPRLAGLAAAMGLGIGGMSMMGDDEAPVEVPFRREMPQETPVEIEEELQEEQPEVQAVPQLPSAFKEETPEKDESTQYDFVSRLLSAQQEGSRNDFNNALLRAANQAGSAIASLGAGAQVKPDYSGVEALEKSARQGVKDITQQMETKSTESRLNKMERELADDKKLRDPQSNVSKMTKEILARHGINVNSAKDAQAAGINIQNIILQEIAAKDRKEIAEIQAGIKTKQGEQKLSKEKQDNIFKLRRNLTEGNIGKMYNNVNNAARTASLLQDFLENPSAFGDFGTLLIGLKALQGDDSVVRGEEMKLGMSATSLYNKVKNQVDRIQSGRSLQPAQRADMLRAVKSIRDISSDKYKMMAAPVLEQARDMDIDEKFLLPEYLRDFQGEKSAAKSLTTNKKKTILKKQYSPSRDQTKIVYSDGSEEILDGKQ